jgi:two-component system cell cycle sensor histidine kinase/response regulator CckA
MNILIVDDNLTNLKLMRTQLEGEGHEITQAHDGVEALTLLEHQPVDAVISDILMPRMDGYGLCREIRKNARFRNLPTIIYSSTFTSPDDVKLALDVGADKYLSKPASLEIIVAALDEVIAKPHLVPDPEALPQPEGLKEYSQRLVDKLADKKNRLEAANRQLSATRDQLAHLLKYSAAVLYSLKIKGDVIILGLVSENMIQLLGFTAEESCSLGWWTEHLHPDDREHALAGVPETIARGVSNSEYRIRHKAGHYLWVQDNRQLVRNVAGEPTDIVGVWTNITERKQTESQVLRAQRLESIGTLACGVAHDLNNVLTPILITTELMRLDFPGLPAESLDFIETSAKRGTDMVKHLLAFVKGAEGERLPVQTLSLLTEMEKLIEISFPKNVEVRTRCATDLWPIVGDATQLQQVLLNLCVNARDAMPEGGILSLQAENIELDAAAARGIPEARAGSYVAWTVSDTGMGIPVEILDRIFEPFFSTKDSEKGTGLGLSTVSGIVKSHRGFLKISSVVGQGSTFMVCLPTSRPDDGAGLPAAITQPSFDGRGETVLVVEDDASMRKFLRLLLTGLNFKVLTAADGASALIQVSENQADLRAVITDINMPNMDGLDFARVLKAKLPGAGVIVVSGKIDEPTRSEFKRLNVFAMLDKPFVAEQMIEILRNFFKR